MKRHRQSEDNTGRDEPDTVPAKKKRLTKFGDFNLKDLGLPKGAWPDASKKYTGKYSYTVAGRSGSVTWFCVFTFFHFKGEMDGDGGG